MSKAEQMLVMLIGHLLAAHSACKWTALSATEPRVATAYWRLQSERASVLCKPMHVVILTENFFDAAKEAPRGHASGADVRTYISR